MRVEERVRPPSLSELGGRDRIAQPPSIRLPGELEHPTLRPNGDPVHGELSHERVEPLPGKFACGEYAAAPSNTAFSCSSSRMRLCASRNSATSSQLIHGSLPSSTPERCGTSATSSGGRRSHSRFAPSSSRVHECARHARRRDETRGAVLGHAGPSVPPLRASHCRCHLSVRQPHTNLTNQPKTAREDLLVHPASTLGSQSSHEERLDHRLAGTELKRLPEGD